MENLNDPVLEGYLPLEADVIILMTQKNKDQLCFEGHKYILSSCDYNPLIRGYECLWACNAKCSCPCRARTLKFVLEDRENNRVSKDQLNSVNNIYPNYNLLRWDNAIHNCVGLTEIEIEKQIAYKINKCHMRAIPATHIDTTLSSARIVDKFLNSMHTSANKYQRIASKQINSKSMARTAQRQRKLSKNQLKEVFTSKNAADIDSDSPLFPYDMKMSDHKDENLRNLILLFHNTKRLKDKLVDGVRTMKDHYMMIFGDVDLLCEMFQNDRFFIDGTFKTCPKQFSQVLQLHFIVNGKIFTGAYILITGKHKELMKWALDELFNIVQNSEKILPGNPIICWTRCTTDFESSIVFCILS